MSSVRKVIMNYLKIKLFVFVSLSMLLWTAAGNAADEAQAPAAETPKIAIKPDNTDTTQWFLPYEKPFRMTGFEWFESDRVYERLPVNKPETVTQYPNGKATSIASSQCGAFHLSPHTSGGQVQFRTDSAFIQVSGELAGQYRGDNISPLGSSAFALYYRENDGGNWVYAGASRFDHSQDKFTARIGGSMTRKTRDCLLYFPTYCGVKSLAIGLDKDAVVEAPRPWKDPRKVIFYGTSITQGGCASHSGADAGALLSRDLDMPVLNYGFSGNGKGEPEIARMLVSIQNPALYILDYEWNIISGEEMAASITPFIDILREAHPETPILVMSHTPGSFEGFDQDDDSLARFKAKREAMILEVQKRQADGDKKIEFLDGNTLLGEDWWNCLVDGCHLSDFGFYRQEKVMLPVVQRMLKNSAR